jgi:hypothetical protein
VPLPAPRPSRTHNADRSLWLQPLSANICIGGKRTRHRATINELSLQAGLAVDGPPVAQGTSGFEGALLAAGPGDDFGAAIDLVAPGAALTGPEYYSVGNGRCAVSNAAGADGMAGLQALVK